jgi:hypothetical protein
MHDELLEGRSDQLDHGHPGTFPHLAMTEPFFLPEIGDKNKKNSPQVCQNAAAKRRHQVCLESDIKKYTCISPLNFGRLLPLNNSTAV